MFNTGINHWAEHEFKVTDKVRLVSDPAMIGMIFDITPMGDITRYGVFLNGEMRYFYTGQIIPFEEKKGKFTISPEELQCFVTAYLINKPTSESLYSMNTGRIEFIPYQFRPVLKLMKADEPRLLIADSVGVGKTIEAGLIIKELEAQRQIDSILIICPKPLVAEEKWNHEMERFDEHFVSVDKKTLQHIMDQNNRELRWPTHYRKLVIPYSIMDEQLYEGTDDMINQHVSLQTLDPQPHFDLVIIDEAHHIRNGSMEKDKAFNYKCVRHFCEHASAVVMLTATPIQNSDHDLYTLLNVLRPDMVVSPKVFDTMSAPNAAITACAHVLRSQSDDWQQVALQKLQGVKATAWGKQVVMRNPKYESVVARLSGKPLSREERVQLIHDVEALHSFDCMINRTRRRDVQDFCVRRSHTISVPMSPEQEALHHNLLDFQEEALRIMHGDRGILFMTSTIRRQAASCLFGLASCIRAMIDYRFNQLEGDDLEGILHKTMTKLPLSLIDKAKLLAEQAESIPEEDPKFAALIEIVEEVNARNNNKMILFSGFRHTLGYLLPMLQMLGLRVAQVDGSVNSEERLKIRKRFELPREDVNAYDILLFTEVGSEGLDYQFCDTIVNYDLPWNPMRIEQRIGRIDRRGQKSNVVHIYNMITEDTVDADIYSRCLMRIGVFERSIGDCEAILGEISSKLEKMAYDSSLTREELQRKLEQMADNEVRKVQEMNRLEDEQRDLFGIALSEDIVSKEVKAAENPWLSPMHLQNLVTQYMQREITDGRNPFLGQGKQLTLMLSGEQRMKLLDEAKKLQNIPEGIWLPLERYLKGTERYQPVTFYPDASVEFEDRFVLNVVHPFVRIAAAATHPTERAFVNVFIESEDLPEGVYPFHLYAWQYTGFKKRSRIIPVCQNEMVEQALVSILQQGCEANEPSPSMLDWEQLEQAHLNRWKQARCDELEEAQKYASYRIQTLTANSTVKQNALKEQIKTVEDNARLARMHGSQLQDEREKLQARIERVNAEYSTTDIHSTLLSKGTVQIRRNGK